MAGYGRRYKRAREEEALLGDGDSRVEQSSLKPRSARYRWTFISITALMGVVVLAAVCLVIGYEPLQTATSISMTHPDWSVVSSFRSEKASRRPPACSSVSGGYQCFADISHRWGQYSPFFSLAEEGPSGTLPDNCHVTFVQVLSRHGARYPTESKSQMYAELVAHIQANATTFEGKAAFLRQYNYTMGGDDLTTFGERQMVNSGAKFYQRYAALSRGTVPFIRASDSARVVASGEKFIQGFQRVKDTDPLADREKASPKINVIISEDSGFNNTLNHNTCPRFESSDLGDTSIDSYAAIFVPEIAHRLEEQLPGVTFSNHDVIYLMDLCAFDTISATPDGSKQSLFCDLFTRDEWVKYDYLQSLGKYYGYGAGNPLGPTQGVGFVNELIARLTQSPVLDNTSTNHTLDAPGAATFPLDAAIYADFTHDNGLIPVFFALGLYNGTEPLPRGHVQSDAAANGYSAAWTVPFAAHAYIEMMQCRSEVEPLVRVLVNDRVVPLHGCEVDQWGRCRRDDFVRGLSFARADGVWENCYS